MSKQLAIAVFTFPGDPPDLRFKEGTYIWIHNKDNSGWWDGEIVETGVKGQLPYNYVRLCTPAEVAYFQSRRNGMVTPGPSLPQPQQEKTETLSSVTVKPLVQGKEFEIILQSDKASYKGTKRMAECRKLEDIVLARRPNFKRLPPVWADKYFVNDALEHRRAAALQDYFQTILDSGKPVLHYALVTWLDPNNKYKHPPWVRKIYGETTQHMQWKVSLMEALKNPKQMAQVEYNYDAMDPVELSLTEGEVVAILTTQTSDEGWWAGETADGLSGQLPGNYVRLLSPQEAKNLILGNFTAAPVKKKEPKTIKKKEEMWAVPALWAFDELLQHGYVMLSGERRFKREGKHIKKNDQVEISYSGYIWNCQEQCIYMFQSSIDGDEAPMKFLAGNEEIILGLDKAVMKMGKGDSARIIIRPDHGFGDVGNPKINVPANVHLIYDVTVEKVSKPKGQPMTNQEPVESYETIGGENANTNLASFFSAQNENRTSLQLQERTTTKGVKNRGANGRRGTSAKMNGRRHGTDIKIRKKSQNGKSQFVSPSNEGSSAAVPKYALMKLQEIVRKQAFKEYQVDPDYIENSLSPNDFSKAFGCSKETWILYPRWKQMKLKKDAKLI